MAMRRFCSFLIIVALIFCLPACAKSAEVQWQEQYDLGVRYLSEGNYEEAVIAFTAAIEIDPNRAEAYVGRGDAYIGSGETEERLAAALSDYEMALELNEMLVEAYLGLAEIYILQGEKERAREILQNALWKFGNDERIEQAISETYNYNSYGGIEFTERYGYRDSSDLTNQEISWLEAALIAAANFDETALEQLAIQCMDDTHNQGFTLLTTWNGYKVRLSCNYSHYNSPSLDGEFRPENSVGYSFFVDTPGEPTGIAGSSYSGTSRLASCQCMDWQWNGVANIIEVNILMDTYEVETSLTSTGTVPMVNSLRNGDFVCNYTYFTTTTTYSEGITVSIDGEPAETDDIYWSIVGGMNGPLEDILDYLYW